MKKEIKKKQNIVHRRYINSTIVKRFLKHPERFSSTVKYFVLCVDVFECIFPYSVPKSDRTTVHKNLIVALGVAELLLMCSDWVSTNEVRV